MDKRYFSDKVAEWYLQNLRDLPWRQTRDPYKIWLSEIILQQTRVAQGMPYYIRFVEKYPTVVALAAASETEILRLWQGLGYYTRARNLHKCAKTIVSDHHGEFPETFAELLTLPGIGEYTAAAIASFAFRESVAVVDGNVFRVLARIFGITTPINSPEGKKEFGSLAAELISKENPDIHNQAMMEFGAIHCTPKNPSCDECPFRNTCVAAKERLQEKLPVKIKGKGARTRYFNYFVIKKGNKLSMQQRASKDIWKGLFDFYLIETKRHEKSSKLLTQDAVLRKIKYKGELVTSKKYKHVLTHQIIMATFTILENSNGSSVMGAKYFSPKKIAELPKPVLISRFLDDYQLL